MPQPDRTVQRNTNNEPLVSVIIPTFNYAHFVLSAIESVRHQDYPNVEIIVIDDGSTDETGHLLTETPGINYVRQENQGLSAARNHGIRLARGKYLQFLDADDLLGATSIRKRVEFLEKNRDKNAVICRSAFFSDFVHPEPLAHRHPEWRQPEAGHVDLALCYFNIAPPHAFLVRKSAVDDASLSFDTSLRACEDYDFWFRLAQSGGVPGMLQSCWVYYRQHPGSMSRSYKNQYRHDTEMCRRVLAQLGADASFVGSRPMTDCLSAMLAASLMTARRLWSIDRPSFDDFISGHVLPLQQKLVEAQLASPASAAALFYLAQGRLLLHKMGLRDHSLDWARFDRLRRPFFSARSYFMSALAADDGSVSLYTAARLLKLDMQYAVLRLLSAPARAPATMGKTR